MSASTEVKAKTIAAPFQLVPKVVSLKDIGKLAATDKTIRRVYVIRHGESIFNVIDPITKIRTVSGASLTAPLTAKGEEQAIALGKLLKSKLESRKDFIVCSSIAVRAQQTARAIFNSLKSSSAILNLLKIPYKISLGKAYEGLVELKQGDFEGKPRTPEYNKQLHHWEHLEPEPRFYAKKVEGGESYQDVIDRALPDLQKIIDEHSDKTIFVVAHAAAMNALAFQWSGAIPTLAQQSEFPALTLDNCDILMVEIPKGYPIAEGILKMHIKAEV